MHKIRNDQILKTSKAELPTELSAVRWRPGGKQPPINPRREKMRQEARLKFKHVPTSLYKLIEKGRKKLRKAKKGCSEA